MKNTKEKVKEIFSMKMRNGTLKLLDDGSIFLATFSKKGESIAVAGTDHIRKLQKALNTALA